AGAGCNYQRPCSFRSRGTVEITQFTGERNHAMRMCPKCMAENMDTEKFCRQCASPLQQSGGKTCPSGRHTMDPTWTECAYCKQENVAAMPGPAPSTRTPTVFE